MKPARHWGRLRLLARARALLHHELQQIVTIRKSDRPWQMPFAAALASGLPLVVGAYFGRMDYGLISSLGGLVFLYLPETPLQHRMVFLMAAAFGMIASYALGVITHLLPIFLVPILTSIAVVVTVICRFYRVHPPGALFFIMAAAIGAYTPGDIMAIPLKVGLIAMGCLLAFLIAFFYSLHILRYRSPRLVLPLPKPSFDYVVFDSVIIGLSVGLSLALAQLLQMEKAYWVPVSCLAVIQGMTLRAVWDKQVHRIIGTGIGLLLAWGLLSLSLNPWLIALAMIVLPFIVETLVVRHYGFASIFITPMTILLADAATLGEGSATLLIRARFFDTLLGCLIGLAGGVCLHHQQLRALLGPPMRRLIPLRFFAHYIITTREKH